MKIDENGVLYEIEPDDVVDGNLVIPDGVKKIDWGDYRIGRNLENNSNRTWKDEEEARGVNLYSVASIVKNVQLPNTLMELCDKCFLGFRGLEKIILPDSVTKIGEECFRDCEHVKQIRLSRRLEEIPKWTFLGCKLNSLIIPDSVHTIAKNAFAENDYTNRVDSVINNVRFPQEMDKVELFMLNNVGSTIGMKYITLPKVVEQLSIIYKNPYDEIVMPNKLGFNNKIEESIERVVEQDSSKFIFRNKKGSKVFEKNISNLRNEEQPIGRKEIGMSEALEQEKLSSKNVKIEGYEIISEFAFAECENLEELIIAEGVKSIERGAFAFCPNLKRVQLPKSLEYIGSSAFKECKQLIQFDTPEGPEIIGNEAFENCENLMFAPLSKGVKNIGNASFKNCKHLLSINLSDGLEQIGNNAFENCCCIPQDYEISIPSNDNEQLGMPKVKIPNKIIVSIPKTVKSIGKYAFAGCQNINYVHMMDGCKVQEIQDGTFQGCDKLELFDISNEVEIIGEEAFKDCKSLRQITCLNQTGLPEKMKEIKSKAFENCENLGLVLTNGEVKRETDSFNNAKKMTEANIKDLDVNVEVIDGKVFDVIKPQKKEKSFSLKNIKDAINKHKDKGQIR